MKNVFLTAALVLCCAQIAYADTAYFPPYVTGVDKTTCATWTPTDGSGASLIFTVNSAQSCHTVNSDGTFSETLSTFIQYPATASSSNAMVQLPYIATAQYGSCAMGISGFSTAITAFMSFDQVQFRVFGGTQVTNLQLSGDTIAFTCSFQATS